MSTVAAKNIDKMAKDLFCDFLAIAIHGLLRSRKVYPDGVFKLRQKFNIPVQVCYHPDVFNYITELVKEIKEVLVAQSLHAVHVLVGPLTGATPLEQFTFKLHSFNSASTQEHLLSLERDLRVCLLKLAIVESYLPTPSSSADITWRVEVDAADSQLGNGTTWCKTAPESVTTPTSVTRKQKVIPLKTVSNDSLKLELFVKT